MYVFLGELTLLSLYNSLISGNLFCYEVNLYDINTATSSLFNCSLMFAQYILLFFSFYLPIVIFEMSFLSIAYSWIVLFFPSNSLHLLIDMFGSFMMHVIIDMFGFRCTILLFVFLFVLHVFCFFVSPFLLFLSYLTIFSTLF